MKKIKIYVRLPIDAIKDKRLDPITKLLLLELFSSKSLHGSNYYNYKSKSELAIEFGISRPKLTSSFKLLESTGWIKADDNCYELIYD